MNGFVYGNLPGLNMKEGDTVRWHVAAYGTEVIFTLPTDRRLVVVLWCTSTRGNGPVALSLVLHCAHLFRYFGRRANRRSVSA